MRRGLSDLVIGRSRKFLNGLLVGADKRRRRVIPELVEGVLKSGSLWVSRISRALMGPGDSLEKWEKHLTTQLASRKWKDGDLERRMLEAAAVYVTPNTPVAVDLSDIAKPRAHCFEGLAFVRDGSRDEIVPGYWTFEAYARVARDRIVPLLNFVYSLELPPARSEISVCEAAFRKMKEVLGDRAIYLLDRGFDGWNHLQYLERLECRFVLRLRGDRHVLDAAGEEIGAEEEIARRMTLPHVMPFGRRGTLARVGYRQIRIPDLKKVYTLVVAWVAGRDDPMMLLTSEEVTSSLQAERIVQLYLVRWTAEEGVRFVKQELGLETVRVYTLRGIERLVQIAYLAMLVLVVLQDLPERALHRLKRLYPLFRRACDQEYFRLLRGVQNLLRPLPPRLL